MQIPTYEAQKLQQFKAKRIEQDAERNRLSEIASAKKQAGLDSLLNLSKNLILLVQERYTLAMSSNMEKQSALPRKLQTQEIFSI